MELLSLFAQVDQVAEKVPFTNQWWFTPLILIAIIAISFFAGKTIARSVKIQEHGWKLSLIFFCVLFSAYYVSDNWPPKFGVDLKGGVTFIVDLNLDNDPELVVDKWLGYDKNGDQILDADEVPQDRRAEWAVMDKDDDSAVSVDEVRAKANRDAKENGANQESVENVIDQLKKRIDPSGIYEVDLRALGNDQIEITIPGVEPGAEADRILDRIKKAGYLQFRILARKTEEEHAATIDAAMAQASGLNMDLRGRSEVRSAGGSGDSLLGRWVNVGLLDAERSRQLKLKTRPYRYTLPFNQQMGVNVLVRNSATGEIINQIPSMPEGLNPDSPEGVRFLQNPKLLSAFLADWWNENYITEFPNARMQILVIEPPEKENVEGGDLVPNLVRSTTDRTGRPAVEFTLKKEGVPKFSRLTGNNIGRSLGMILDGELLSAPNINSKIFKNGIIEGDFTSKEVRDLISILKAGQLRTTLQSPDGGGDLIDSTMGQEMKDRGFWAIGASFVLILGFLVVYYQIAGIVSCLALILNMTMILTVIMMLGQPLTLNGLAGLVLTVGMSVDANVLIFERIREELSKDATLRMAIRNGFQRATTTIVDANITTFITAFILYVIGNEQLKSFSVALMLGIVLSMFTAIFCSRVLFDVFEKKRWLKNLGGARLFTNSNINFVGKRSVAFVFSAIFIAVGIGAIFARGGTMLNHDLAGGSMAKVVFSEATPLEDINQILRKIESKTMVNDSQAEISVAELTSDLYPSQTYYRFESNIKSKDGEKSLSDLILSHFEGQLAKQSVSFEVTSGPVLPEDDDAANGPDGEKNESVEVSDDEKSATPATGPDTPVTNATGPETTETDADDEAKNEAKNEADQKQSDGCNIESDSCDWQEPQDSSDVLPGSTVQETSEPKQAEPKQAEPKQAEPKQAEPKQANGSDIETKSLQENLDPAAINESGIQNSRFVTTAKLEFKLSLKDSTLKKKAASLRGDFEDAAKKLSLDNYTTDNIKLRDGVAGGNFITEGVEYETDVWEVEITTQGADHGERILEQMISTYNQEVFLPQAKEVGERFAQKAWLRAFAAMFASLVGIVAYIWIRFQRVSFGLAAVVALIHDVLVVLGAIAISFWLAPFLGIILVENFKISLAVIAALLTIIGYSLNDTIVVFDRIREVRGKNPKLSGDMVNRSLNQTLSRTILTSLTTFIVVIILYGAGGDAIHGFAFALVVGVIVGTYSSIFVASPVLLMLMKSEATPES